MVRWNHIAPTCCTRSRITKRSLPSRATAGHDVSSLPRLCIGRRRRLRDAGIHTPNLVAPFVSEFGIMTHDAAVLQLNAATFASSRRPRLFSSSSSHRRNNRDYDGKFQLDALPFSVSPEEALQQFESWAIDEQGLRYFLQRRSIRINAAYAPVWSFDLNVRFATLDGSGSRRRRYDLKPEPFAIYRGSNTDVVHLPGVSAYAGYTYRRSLINPVHNTTLVFMKEKLVPFGSWMLRDMRLSSSSDHYTYYAGNRNLHVFPDPWNATRSRALAVVKDELQDLADDDVDRIGPCTVETELLSSRRAYMPTWVIEYSVWGVPYQAFVSGCDSASGVSGVSHKVLSGRVEEASNSFLNHVQNVTTAAGRSVFRGGGNVGPILALANVVLNATLKVVARLLSRIHIVGLLGGGFVAFRKIVQPWMDDRSASAAWERQREHEAFMHDHWDHNDDFTDGGYAKRYFDRNRDRILRYLSGEHSHTEGEFDWYKQWEAWARRQYEQQRAYEEQTQSQQQRDYEDQTRYQREREQKQRAAEGQKRRTTQRPKKEYQWDFDPSDPYSVLGIKRGATKTEVSHAFRREMLKHHPDTQAGATPAAKERSVERSKLITEAYRKIRAQMK